MTRHRICAWLLLLAPLVLLTIIAVSLSEDSKSPEIEIELKSREYLRLPAFASNWKDDPKTTWTVSLKNSGKSNAYLNFMQVESNIDGYWRNVNQVHRPFTLGMSLQPIHRGETKELVISANGIHEYPVRFSFQVLTDGSPRDKLRIAMKRLFPALRGTIKLENVWPSAVLKRSHVVLSQGFD